ncbi:MAG: PAS domain-containing sensor histidine kinase, partial [Chloroflexota bacterium]
RHAADLEWRVAQRTVELNYAKERAEAILNHSADGIVLLSATLIIEQTNLAFNEIFAAWDDAYFQQPFTELLEESERARINEILQSGNIEKKGQRLETRARRKDGTIFDAELAIGFIKKKGVVCIIRDVTKRKQAEKAIAEERNLLRTLIDALPDFIYVKDTHHKTLLSNISRTRLFGLTLPEETIGKDDYAFIPAEMVEQFHADEDRLFQTLEPIIDKEEHTIGLSNDFIWALTTKVPLHNLNGELIGLVGITRDISERKQREQRLRFDAGIQASISDAVIATDLQFCIQSWNKAAEKIYGWNAVDTVGKKVNDILQTQYESDAERVQIVDALLEEGHWQGEFTQLKKDGTKVYIQSSTSVFKDENGVSVGVVSVNRDVTERRKAQETLRLSEERYRLLAENITDIISRVSPEGVYIDVSSSSKTVFGYAPEEMIGKDGSDFIHPDDVDIVLQKRQESLRRRIEFPLTYRFRHRDGHYIWLEVARKFILSEETNKVKEIVTSSRDITVRKRAEEALKNALEKEKELSELKSRFVSMASHEFRTPLATILATSETLSAYRSKLGENQIQDKLNKISHQVSYLKAIIEDTLQVARLQDPKAKFEPVDLDLDAVCRSVIDEFESRPDVMQQFVYTCDDKLQQVRVDRKLIRQMINNLLSNAVKYSAPNSVIYITLKRTHSELVLKVQDHGIGIPEADLKHLFEPFHRAANVGTISGTGLGLVIAKESVELHGGLMSVETKVDVGTTFTIMIPLQ